MANQVATDVAGESRSMLRLCSAVGGVVSGSDVCISVNYLKLSARAVRRIP